MGRVFRKKKRCALCKKRKLLKYFYKNNVKGKQYRSAYCRKCTREYQQSEKYKKTKRRYGKKYYASESNKENITSNAMKRRYGISIEDYEEMLKKQKGACAICGKKECIPCYGKVRRLSIDHEHRTGKVRGLLCSNCNLLLRAVEDTEFLIRAQMYLTGK